MRFGLSVYNVSATVLADLAVAAEALGFESLWLGEHMLCPVGYTSVHPTREQAQEAAAPLVAPDTELTDPLVALAGAAVRTTRLQLGTAIYLLPLRHPLAVARAALTLAELSAGRFLLGAGAGWLEAEFEALGVPFAARGQRFEESLDILRLAWAGGPFEYHGRVYDFGPLQLTPHAVPVPLVVGGNTPRALRRAASHADGWFASGTPSADDAIELLGQLEAAQAEAGRAVPLTTYVRVTPSALDNVGRYADAGFSQVVFWAHELCPSLPGLYDPGLRGGGLQDPSRWDGLAAAAARLGITQGSMP
jgi:probable F420-dependent oxidoreductase